MTPASSLRRRIDMSARRNAGLAGQRLRARRRPDKAGGRPSRRRLRPRRHQNGDAGGHLVGDVGGAKHRGGVAAPSASAALRLPSTIDEHALAALGGGGDAGDLDRRNARVDELGAGQIRDLSRRIPACRHEEDRIGHCELYPDGRPPDRQRPGSSRHLASIRSGSTCRS